MAGVDPILFRLAREMVKLGSVVWDVGANQGLFSFPAAWLAGPEGLVVAVEPDPKLADLIVDSCALTALVPRAPITVVPLAVTNSVGLQEFHIAKRARASNHLQGFGSTQAGSTRQSFPVLTVSLDWLVEYLPPPQVIKIDVEGAEATVLRGATNMLRRHRPALICEVSSENAEECTRILRSFNYAIYDGSKGLDGCRRLDMCPWSTIAIPKDTDPRKESVSVDRKRYAPNVTP